MFKSWPYSNRSVTRNCRCKFNLHVYTFDINFEIEIGVLLIDMTEYSLLQRMVTLAKQLHVKL